MRRNWGIMSSMRLHSCKLQSMPISESSARVRTPSCSTLILEHILMSLPLRHPLAEYVLVSASRLNESVKSSAWSKHTPPVSARVPSQRNNSTYRVSLLYWYQEIGTQLQEAGHECGTTTGRKRRCGWLDAVQLRYSNQINGYTSVNLTKLDVLDGLEEIKIGNKYSYEGNEIPYFPADLKVLEKVEVEYITLKGWKTKTSECTLYTQLPIEARRYVETIEQLLRVKIEWVGIGPGRDRMLTR